MRFVNLFLIGYVVLILGVTLALAKAHVLQHISGVWIAIASVIVIGVGIMLSVASGKPAVTKE